MKKLLLSLTLLASLFITSCKKDRTCECTYSSNEPGYTASIVDVTIIDSKKKDAKKTTDCKLK